MNFKPSVFGKGSHSQFQCWDHENIRIFSQVSPVKLAFWNISRLHDRQKGGSLCDRREPLGIQSIRKGKHKNFCGSSCLREMLAAMDLRIPSSICMFISGATATEYRLLWRWLRIYSTAITCWMEDGHRSMSCMGLWMLCLYSGSRICSIPLGGSIENIVHPLM